MQPSTSGLAKPVTKQKLLNPCTVCGAPSHGNHFGAESCRACAGFFTRCVKQKKKFTCKGGKDTCSVSKDIHSPCKQCRFRKCLEVGMLPENVNIKEITTNQYPEEAQPICRLTVGHDSRVSRESSDSSREASHEPTRVLHLPLTTNMEVINDVYYSGEPPVYLNKITNAYRSLTDVRKSMERALLTDTLHNLFTVSGNTAFMNTTVTQSSTLLRAALTTNADFVANTFEEFQLFDQDEKCSLFHECNANMWVADIYFRAYKYLPAEDYDKICMLTDTTYTSIDRLEHFLDDCTEGKLSRSEAAIMLTAWFHASRVIGAHAMNDLKLQDEEYAAILAMLLFNSNITNITDNIVKVSKDARTRIFHELHLFYRYNNIDDYSQRLGELLVLYANILQETQRSKTEISMFHVFEVFKGDSYYYEFLK